MYPGSARVACAGVVFCGDMLLLVKRAKEPQKGMWTFPGGSVELGEYVADAVCREVREETALEVRPIGVVACVDYIETDEAGEVVWHYLIVDIICEWVSGEPVASGDVEAVRWVGADQLDESTHSEETISVAKRAFNLREKGYDGIGIIL